MKINWNKIDKIATVLIKIYIVILVIMAAFYIGKFYAMRQFEEQVNEVEKDNNQTTMWLSNFTTKCSFNKTTFNCIVYANMIDSQNLMRCS